MPSIKTPTFISRSQKRLKRGADSDGSDNDENTEYETDTSDSSYVPPKKNKKSKK
jgi:hypothetical protein